VNLLTIKSTEMGVWGSEKIIYYAHILGGTMLKVTSFHTKTISIYSILIELRKKCEEHDN
jgi:hypothetical protein